MKSKMVDLGDETSNRLFNDLSDWNTYLKKHTPNFTDAANHQDSNDLALDGRAKLPQRKGPSV